MNSRYSPYEGLLGSASILIPLGVSFYIFQIISFQVDTLGKKKHKLSLIDFFLYIAFFPQLVSGPIVRFHRFFSQLQRPRVPSQLIYAGIGLLILGLAKKVLIADSIGLMIWPHYTAYNSAQLYALDQSLLLIFGLTAQHYFDFAAYSDMAVGIGYLFGYSLPINFRSPFRASNIADGWKRINITLTKFIRIYIYKNLGWLPWYAKITICMFVFGFWHSFSWNIALFGLMHSLFLILHMILRRSLFRKPSWLRLVIEKSVFVLVILVSTPLFNMQDLDRFFHLFQSVLECNSPSMSLFSNWELQFILGTFLATLTMPNAKEFFQMKYVRMPHTVGATLLAFILFFCLFFLGRTKSFLYFFY